MIVIGIDPGWNWVSWAIVFDDGLVKERIIEHDSIEISPYKADAYPSKDEYLASGIDNSYELFSTLPTISKLKHSGEHEVFGYIEKPLYVNNGETTIKISFVVAGLYLALDGYCKSVKLVNNNTWKKHIIGKGNANKEDIANNMQSMGMKELPKKRWDEYDAAAIALYGHGVEKMQKARGK